ncbi:phage tail assembly protein [Paenibacillus naphthalenovorans]|uniref:phage tail assembly protein n=1 Tax=Paenibacillus naphthalenovorans TaxID=162209 RepID=UPI003D29A4CF
MSEYIIKFKKPHTFEGGEYTEIDLSGLENLNTSDLIDADKEFSTSGQFSMMNELTIGYTCIVAAKATGKPVEFFQRLPASDGLKVKNKVMGFLNG